MSLVFRWRRQAGLPGKRASVKKAAGVFVPLVLTTPAAPDAPLDTSRAQAPDGGLIDIELANGRDPPPLKWSDLKYAFRTTSMGVDQSREPPYSIVTEPCSIITD